MNISRMRGLPMLAEDVEVLKQIQKKSSPAKKSSTIKKTVAPKKSSPSVKKKASAPVSYTHLTLPTN